jgi:hypothetical protein
VKIGVIYSVEISNSGIVICSYDMKVVNNSIREYIPRLIVTSTSDNIKG